MWYTNNSFYTCVYYKHTDAVVSQNRKL